MTLPDWYRALDERDELARRRELDRAEQARRILEDPLWLETWDSYEQSLIEHATNTAEDASDEIALKARDGLRVLRRVRRDLEFVLETGDMAKVQLIDSA